MPFSYAFVECVQDKSVMLAGSMDVKQGNNNTAMSLQAGEVRCDTAHRRTMLPLSYDSCWEDLATRLSTMRAKTSCHSPRRVCR